MGRTRILSLLILFLLLLGCGGGPPSLQPTQAQGRHPLFHGANSWVCSLTTISSPHDGTTLTYRYDLDHSMIKPLFVFMISLTIGMSLLKGAMELNRWVQAQPAVYYFSWATEATYRDPLSGNQVPEIGVPAHMVPIAHFLGSFSRDDSGGSALLPSLRCKLAGRPVGQKDSPRKTEGQTQNSVHHKHRANSDSIGQDPAGPGADENPRSIDRLMESHGRASLIPGNISNTQTHQHRVPDTVGDPEQPLDQKEKRDAPSHRGGGNG